MLLKNSFKMYLQVLVFAIIFGCCSCSSSEKCEEESNLAVLTSSYTAHRTCSQQHIKDSLKSNIGCKPMTVVLELPWPNNTDIQQMTPTHIEVRRCEGGCHQTGHGCAALRTQVKKVPVMFGKCGMNVGKCEKECAHVTVEEHTECGCACELRREECASDTHNFRPELCTCECRDTRAKRECLDQGRTWSEESCSCGCPLSMISECPEGFVYDYNTTCSCVAVIQTEDFAETERRVEEEVKELGDILSWEMVIIIALVSILMLLSLITIILVIRLRTMRKKVNSNQSLVPSTLSGQYFPCSDPCSDLVSKKNLKNNLPSLSDSDSERCREHLTDSSLCSEEKDHWNELSEGSSESLATVRQNRLLSDNCHQALRQPDQCLESVRLNRNLAIRSRVGGSGTLQRGESPSNYNTVKIVYRNGEKTMELNCQMEPSPNEQLNITTNPLVYNM